MKKFWDDKRPNRRTLLKLECSLKESTAFNLYLLGMPDISFNGLNTLTARSAFTSRLVLASLKILVTFGRLMILQIKSNNRSYYF